MELSSAQKRLAAFFELYPNEAHDVFTLAAIGRVRDWERALRYVRAKGLNIVWDATAKTYANVT